MSALPTTKLLASYWIPYVGIGKPEQRVTVPLTDIANYVLANGRPQTSVVFLGFGVFTGTPQNFTPPYISVPQDLIQQMTLQPGQTQTNVQYLQSLGIKVLLSVMGWRPNDVDPGMGWDGVPLAQNEPFALWVKKEIIDAYGLDGIDIDNEFSNLPENTQSFMNTVATLRFYLPGSLLTKALWADTDYFTCPVSNAPGNVGAYLSGLLDLGCTMAYGYNTGDQQAFIEGYTQITANGGNVGMAWNQLCLGVQAGPPESDWMTAIDEVQALAQWVVEQPQARPCGMMLFTFPQDIQQWTHWPQNSPGYMYPNTNDHEWQKAIIQGMWGSGNWIVKS